MSGYEFSFDVSPDTETHKVFYDPSQGRRRRTLRYVWSAVLLITAGAIMFFSDAFESRILSSTSPDLVVHTTDPAILSDRVDAGALDAKLSVALPPGGLSSDVNIQTLVDRNTANLDEPCTEPSGTLAIASAAQAATSDRRLHAFLPSDKDWSYGSLRHECGSLNVLMPDWFAFEDETLAIGVQQFDAEAKQVIGDFISKRRSDLKLIPTVRMRPGIDSNTFFLNLAVEEKRQQLIKDLLQATRSAGADGLCLDFGRITRARAPIVGSFASELKAALARNERELCLVFNAKDDAWESAALADASDYVVVRMFDQPWVGSPVAPLAEQHWFMDTTAKLVAHFGAERLVVALGTQSYDWVAGSAAPEPLGYAEAMARIGQAGAQVRYNAELGNSYSIFVDRQRRRHVIWMLDAVSMLNEMQYLEQAGISNVAIWGLGNEDPGIWSLVSPTGDPVLGKRSGVRNVLIEDFIESKGEGPFIRIKSPALTGFRLIDQDPETSFVTDVVYSRLPRAAVIEKFGAGAADQLVLTFDDGPDPDFTPPILDALKESGVSAAFFLVGHHIWENRDLVQRMIDEGHEIGSHSYWHPNMREINHSRALLELNMFQRVLGSAAGYGTLLFREPFQRTGGPINLRQAEPMLVAQNMGHFYVSSDVAPADWTDMSAEEIVADVISELEESPGNVIALHDAGRYDRGEVVRAVPLLISELRARGYTFVSLSDLLRIDREAVMPSVELPRSAFFSFMFFTMSWSVEILKWIFGTAIAIGVARMMIMLWLAMRRKRHEVVEFGRFAPPVTVIVPAYNEEDTIIDAIESILALKYRDLRVIVVDDGSTDSTFDKLLDRYGRNRRVTILSHFNQGKWSALNLAVKKAETEILICIDADTRIDENAVSRMIMHFKDPEIGAVAGKVIPINRKGLLTHFQALEYMVAQNIDRRAAEHLGAMLVVPGAIGAWRRSAIMACGGYSGDTLTEDADLTVAINRAGYKICYDENAVAETKVPTTIKQLLAQRARWTMGMLQVAGKHRGALREGRALGWFAIPDLLLYGYILAFLAPMADFLFYRFLFELWQSWGSGEPVSTGLPTVLALSYLVLPLLDLFVAGVAQTFDRQEKAWIILLMPVQRFLYRPLLYYSAIRAVLRATTGSMVRWTQVHRGGMVGQRQKA